MEFDGTTRIVQGSDRSEWVRFWEVIHGLDRLRGEREAAALRAGEDREELGDPQVVES